ncbi:hypothetical protein ACLBXM_02175 [Xanthobacteraceae bacterium A53D]
MSSADDQRRRAIGAFRQARSRQSSTPDYKSILYNQSTGYRSSIRAKQSWDVRALRLTPPEREDRMVHEGLSDFHYVSTGHRKTPRRAEIAMDGGDLLRLIREIRARHRELAVSGADGPTLAAACADLRQAAHDTPFDRERVVACLHALRAALPAEPDCLISHGLAAVIDVLVESRR